MAMPDKDSELHPLLLAHRKDGTIEWIGVRPTRLSDMIAQAEVEADRDQGLRGDHYSKRGGRRQVTLIQGEHLDTVASVLGLDEIDPLLTRRNLVVRGINLAALKDRRFRAGDAVFEYAGECHPCSRMEENLGFGGYNAMRGHGGILARVLQGGRIAIGGRISPISIREQYDL